MQPGIKSCVWLELSACLCIQSGGARRLLSRETHNGPLQGLRTFAGVQMWLSAAGRRWPAADGAVSLPDILCAVPAQHVPSSHHDSNYWTTNSGMPVWNNNSSLTVGTRGARTALLISHAHVKSCLLFRLQRTWLCNLPLQRASGCRADPAGGLCARHALICAVACLLLRSLLRSVCMLGTDVLRACVQHLIEKLAQVRR